MTVRETATTIAVDIVAEVVTITIRQSSLLYKCVMIDCIRETATTPVVGIVAEVMKIMMLHNSFFSNAFRLTVSEILQQNSQ